METSNSQREGYGLNFFNLSSSITPGQPKEIMNVIGLKVKCHGVFKALISFRITTYLSANIQVEKITVFGLGEKQKKTFLDQSDLLVFQRITEQANKALNYFAMTSPQSTLKKFLLWLSSYKNLFTQECTLCNRFIRNDGIYLPPVYREYEMGLAYHLQCIAK